jgi:hypothetical protein
VTERLFSFLFDFGADQTILSSKILAPHKPRHGFRKTAIVTSSKDVTKMQTPFAIMIGCALNGFPGPDRCRTKVMLGTHSVAGGRSVGPSDCVGRPARAVCTTCRLPAAGESAAGSRVEPRPGRRPGRRPGPWRPGHRQRPGAQPESRRDICACRWALTCDLSRFTLISNVNQN